MVENQRGGMHQLVGTPKAIFCLGKILSLECGEALRSKVSSLATPLVGLRLQGRRVEREEHDQRAGSQS